MRAEQFITSIKHFSECRRRLVKARSHPGVLSSLTAEKKGDLWSFATGQSAFHQTGRGFTGEEGCELAKRLGCDNSYVTSLMDALEERGLAVRQQHPTDRRVKMIELTERGHALAKRAQLADTTPPVFFAVLSKTEIVTLGKLLRKLDENQN